MAKLLWEVSEVEFWIALSFDLDGDLLQLCKGLCEAISGKRI